MASQPSLRIGDAEREAVAAELREHYAHGRLTLEEFNERLDAVFAAKTQSDLSRLTADLPHVRTWGSLPSARTRPGQSLASGPPPGPIAASWPGSDWAGAGGYSGRRQHHGVGAFATLFAALATWLLVYDVILVGLRWPLPGRLGLLFGVFALVRGLLRRIIRGGSGCRRR